VLGLKAGVAVLIRGRLRFRLPRHRARLRRLRSTHPDAINRLAAERRLVRVEDDVLSRPSVAVGAAKFGDRVPIGDVEDQLFVLALEEEDILFLLIQADPLKLQLGDLKLLATRGQIGSLQVRRWKRFTAGDHQILLSWSRPEFGRSPDGPDQGGRVASK